VRAAEQILADVNPARVRLGFRSFEVRSRFVDGIEIDCSALDCFRVPPRTFVD